jgi:EmrB/QacA subfamily drug resistance transporter
MRTREHSTQNAILALACLAQFMVILDVSIVNVALPQIGRELHYSATGLQWVVNAYVLTFAGFLLLGGRAADIFGRRLVFLVGLGLFSAASLLGGLAQTSAELTAARAVQGLGGAILSPATLTIITTTFQDGVARNRALGVWSAVGGAGGAAGAVLGGVLTGYLSWRWVLFVNVPVGVVGILLAMAVLDELRRPGDPRSLDFAGAITGTAGLALLVYAIVGTDTHPWGSVHTLVLLAIALALLALFLLLQARVVKLPLMPLSLFRSRSLAAANVAMLLTGAAFFSMWYFLTLYLQDVHGFGPLKAGLLFLPMGIAIIIGAQIGSRLVSPLGPRVVLMAGLASAAGGFIWLAQLDATSSYLAGVLPGSLLTTFGLGLAFTPLAAAATSGVPLHQAGLASGVLNTSRQVGGSIGLAALAAVATSRTHQAAATMSTAQALTAGFTRAFAVAAILAIAACAAASFIPGRPRRSSPEATDLDSSAATSLSDDGSATPPAPTVDLAPGAAGSMAHRAGMPSD